QVGPLVAQHLRCTSGDPLRAGQTGSRSPEGVERKLAELSLQVLDQTRRRAVNAECLVAVGGVVRFWSYGDVNRRALVEPPEQLGAAERETSLRGAAAGGLVERLGLDQSIGLLPEAHLAGVAEQPAVADNAV